MENYEHNLKLFNESIRKDLDITLTSIIPTQKSLMKTILWLNSSIIGVCIATLSKSIFFGYIIIPFLLSFLAILIILFALKDGRVKAFGSPNISDIENIEEDKNEKVMGLIQMNNSFQQAFKNNEELIKKRANKIAWATNKTIISIISIPLLVVFFYLNNANLLKGEKSMAENDNQNTNSNSSRPTMSSATSKPAVMMSTNNSGRTLFANDSMISESTIIKSKNASSTKPSKDVKKDN